MENKIIKFANAQFGEIRTMSIDGEAWFVGKDVAEVLGYKDPSKAICDRVDEEDKTTLLFQQSGSNYKSRTTFINESGLYALILGSKLPQAKEFKRWVTAEVLPQIRKTGGYIPMKDEEGNTLSDLEIMCRAFQIQEKTIEMKNLEIEAKNQQLLEQQPMVDFTHAVEDTEESIYISELAKLITRNGFEIGRNRLFDWMRQRGYLFKNGTEPMQKWVEKGIFSTHISTYEDNHGGVHETVTTKVTGKGQRYFINLFINAIN